MKMILKFKIEKKRIVEAFAFLILLFLFLCFFYFLKSKNEYFISLKDKIVIGLCTISVFFLNLFKRKMNMVISMVGEIACLIIVPILCFFKLEPLVNEMNSIKTIASIFNLVIIFAFFVAIFGITNNVGLTILFGGGLVLAFYVVDYFTIKFRGTPVLFSDILSIKTAAAVSGGYSYVLNDIIVTAFFEWALLIALGFFFSYNKKKTVFMNVSRIVLLLLGIIVLTVLVKSNIVTEKGFRNSAFIPTQSAEENGFLLNCFVNAHNSILIEPDGYNAKSVNEVMKKVHNRNQRETVKSDYPNIIVIMNESFTDVDYLKTVETSEETIPFFKSLQKNSISGTLISSILGGNTPNSEFEFLTGCSLAFLPTGMVAYQQLISKELPSVPTMLKSIDYDTTAVHLYEPKYFDRKRIYPILGFDTFLSAENYPKDEIVVDYPRKGTEYASDKSTFQLIENAYGKRKLENRWFCFCVTIQNHGGYWTGMDNVSVLKQNNAYADEYVSLLKISDDAFKDFIEYFQNIEEPTIVCMYGDHQPYLFADDYVPIWDGYDFSDTEKRFMQSKVPFVIWANYDIEACDMGEMSINYLGPTLLKVAGVPMSDFFWYLDDLKQTLPVISAVGFVDKNGNFFTEINQSVYSEQIKEYEYLQYNYLKGNVNRAFYE